MKSWLGFGDTDLIFKVTAGFKWPNLNKKVLICMLSHEPEAGMFPNLLYYWGRIKSRLDFCDLDLIFLSTRYLRNQLANSEKTNCMDRTLGHSEELIRFWWPWPIFQGRCGTYSAKFKTKRAFLHVFSWTSGCNGSKFACLYYWSPP